MHFLANSISTTFNPPALPSQMATLCCWTIVHGWRSERTQFLRIFELRAELLSYKRLLRLLVPPSLAPALLDKAYRESRGGGGSDGGKVGGSTSGANGRGWVGPAAASSGVPADDDRFAERFDEASVLFAEGEAPDALNPCVP